LALAPARRADLSQYAAEVEEAAVHVGVARVLVPASRERAAIAESPLYWSPLSAAHPPHLGYLSAVSRLSLGCLSVPLRLVAPPLVKRDERIALVAAGDDS